MLFTPMRIFNTEMLGFEDVKMANDFWMDLKSPDKIFGAKFCKDFLYVQEESLNNSHNLKIVASYTEFSLSQYGHKRNLQLRSY